MTNKNKKPLAGPGQAKQQEALNNKVNHLSSQGNSLGLSGQGRVPSDNSVESQRAVILNFLMKGKALSTLHARNEMGIMHVGMRICELRKSGYNIETHWINEVDVARRIHRVGLYMLRPSKQMRLF